ncbi:hypothetical protein [Candidatus Oleimmundimicrobium sp.]|uniref:hypothetical protein n=1 Tax=Candidatus Oleimmundimicrobium sp. TaxID=3060597 RepID=UPI0027256C9E|nr:hypothetical protein [Candidatus Oleimmundimicrobium sp.]MDO8885765.1 hypothetical protein [Candidatus Oleimmundimicrobium sp.]
MHEEKGVDVNLLVQRLGNKLATYEIQLEVMALEIERLKAENELLKNEKKEKRAK